MLDLLGIVLAISCLILAVLMPLAVMGASVAYVAILAARFGGALEHDLPDVNVYLAEKRLSEATDPAEDENLGVDDCRRSGFT